MDETALRRILTSFADSPADVNLAKGQLLIQVRDELLEVGVRRANGNLVIDDNGIEYTTHRWIVERIARLPLLAERILGYVDEEPLFVPPRGILYDELERGHREEPVEVPAVLDTLQEVLGRDRIGTTAVVYLVSDAGEGKTTTINALARAQARAFKEKKTGWLLVPVPLGGRPFLRFDDVVAAALLNRFRFPLFFDSFMELVRMGVLVPALDGFEEMFVEGAAGDAASALGNLMSLMQSSGTALVAARQAYFDYKSLDTQARLYDALSGQSVSFAQVRIRRWNSVQFKAYASRAGLQSTERDYDSLSRHLGSEHPLLTRAFLVRLLVDLLQSQGIDSVLAQIDGGASDYFGELVKPIISREAHRWIDRSGEPFMPLLTEGEHLLLLESVAMEMWLAEASLVPADVLEWAAEVFSEAARKNAAVTRQVVERVKQHALLVNRGGQKAAFQFDHEEFYYYFLGRAVAARMVAGVDGDIKQALRRSALPQLAVESAGALLKASGIGAVRGALTALSRICRGEPAASFVRENSGAVLIRAMHETHGEPLAAEYLVFPRDSLKNRKLSDVTFRHCEFGETEVWGDTLNQILFEQCGFDLIWLKSVNSLASATFREPRIRAIASPESSIPTYDPSHIESIVRRFAETANTPREEAEPVQAEPDDALRAFERVVRRFLRTTEVNEYTIRQATSVYANQFMRDVLPELERRGVLREVQYHGAGQQRRFRLGIPLREVSEAMRHAEGKFERFLKLSSREDE